MQPLLQVNQLSVFFDQEHARATAVDNISFSLPKGSFTALVGESGSGKTMTAYSVLRLLPATARTKGNILFHSGKDTIDLLQCDHQQLRRLSGNKIAMVFQEPMSALNPLMTCGRQIAECLEAHNNFTATAIRNKALELMAMVELPNPENLYKKYPHQISGGQKQRVLLAMAISNHPALLIADEPTTALDIGLQHSMLQLLHKLQQQLQMTVLMISHDLSLVSRYAERIMVMYRGQLVETGTLKEVMLQPKHEYTQALLQCRVKPEWKGKWLPILVDGRMQLPKNSATLEAPKPKNDHVTESIITASNLTVRFPLKKNLWGKLTKFQTAIDHISFEVFKGETLGIVGESGSGKSTLAKLLLNMLTPDAGELVFSDKVPSASTNVTSNNDYSIQLVFQDPYGSLNPRLQIGEAIAETIRVHQLTPKGKDKDQAIDWLQTVGLSPNMYARYPHQFSGGQRQRIGIARALANHPHILVFDESLSALDVSVQAQMLNLIHKLKQQFQFTAIFISHDLPTVYHISDRMLVMKEGKIVEQGKTTDLFINPQHDYTRYLLSLMPDK